MSNRYRVVEGSQSYHCCFEATVVDTTSPAFKEGEFESMCECFDRVMADKIAAALNKEDATP